MTGVCVRIRADQRDRLKADREFTRMDINQAVEEAVDDYLNSTHLVRVQRGRREAEAIAKKKARRQPQN